MLIRPATQADLAAVAALEALCFPPAEAADAASLAARLAAFPQHFLLGWEKDTLVGFVNGMTTDTPDLEDEMYADAALHQESGAWQMIFGLDVHPDYRRQGRAAALLQALIDQARKEGRRGVVLTCKAEKIAYYAKFGFVNEGVSASVHGGVTWYQMRLRLEEAERMGSHAVSHRL